MTFHPASAEVQFIKVPDSNPSLNKLVAAMATVAIKNKTATTSIFFIFSVYPIATTQARKIYPQLFFLIRHQIPDQSEPRLVGFREIAVDHDVDGTILAKISYALASECGVVVAEDVN